MCCAAGRKVVDDSDEDEPAASYDAPTPSPAVARQVMPLVLGRKNCHKSCMVCCGPPACDPTVCMWHEHINNSMHSGLLIVEIFSASSRQLCLWKPCTLPQLTMVFLPPLLLHLPPQKKRVIGGSPLPALAFQAPAAAAKPAAKPAAAKRGAGAAAAGKKAAGKAVVIHDTDSEPDVADDDDDVMMMDSSQAGAAAADRPQRSRRAPAKTTYVEISDDDEEADSGDDADSDFEEEDDD